MKYLKLFEDHSVDLIKRYIKDSKYDIQNSIGNCAFFAKDFYEWGAKNGVDVKIVYFEQDNGQEDHIAPMVDDVIFDFTYIPRKGVSKEVRKVNKEEAINSQLNPLQTSINDKNAFTENGIYGKYGYSKFEIFDKIPTWVKTFEDPKLKKE